VGRVHSKRASQWFPAADDGWLVRQQLSQTADGRFALAPITRLWAAYPEYEGTSPLIFLPRRLLGYSKVAKPIYSIIVSPAGMSKALSLLLKVYRRYDVLEYAEDTRLKVGIWDAVRRMIDPATIIPPGDYF
jgi:hypothetical protein